ncbi:hypothetical protein KDL01_17095 [Actinospica durhamensis]|uniref:Uncharacterized protein n=1 Tax=Actinospica durhamensis TaxID=1508375 RepID=A0A941EW31_9ACTN|nr:hypothetical protein [Actinospica durhamensis]MBR7834994.1 hypothetical protein [Actinospica durhamensis]
MPAETWSRFIDVECLPDEVAALIESLATGEHLLIARDGEPIAAVAAIPTAVIPAPAAQRASAEGAGPAGPSIDHHRVTVVASALRMSDHVRTLLSSSLGENYTLLDFNDAPPTADVLLVGPIGLMLLANLRGRFPRARVMVVEASDDSLGMSSNGPVRRYMDAGAETYLVSPSIPALAAQLEQAVTERAALTGGAWPGPGGPGGISGGRRVIEGGLAIDASPPQS